MDNQALIQALRDTAQSASNSAASNLSAPVDAITWALRKAGLNIPTPVGGSEWMEKKGLTAPVQDGLPKMAGDTLGGLAPIMAVAKAPQIAAGMNRMVDNAMAPATLGKQRGVVGFKYPQDEALATAQRNAAKPVSEGGLGLRPGNTPMERAQAMGFDTPAYHGSTAEVKAVQGGMRKDQFGRETKGFYSSADPEYASSYAEGANGRVMPLSVNASGHTQIIDDGSKYADMVKISPSAGGSGVDYHFLDDGVSYPRQEMASFIPANIRSRFAAFDPMRRNEADLLGRADPALLGLLGIGTGAGVAAYNKGKE